MWFYEKMTIFLEMYVKVCRSGMKIMFGILFQILQQLNKKEKILSYHIPSSSVHPNLSHLVFYYLSNISGITHFLN